MSNASQQEHTYYLLAQFIHFAYHHEEIDTGFRAYIRTNYGIDDEQVLTQLEQYASAASADYTLSPVSSKFFWQRKHLVRATISLLWWHSYCFVLKGSLFSFGG